MQKSFNNALFDDNILDKQTQTDESLYLELETCNLGLNDVEADTISQVTLLCYWIRQNRKLEGKGGVIKASSCFIRNGLYRNTYLMVVIIPISKQTENFQQGKSIWILASSKIYILGLKIVKFMKSNSFIRQVW